MKQTKLKYSRKLAHKIRDIIRSTKNKISIAKFRVACKFRKALNAKIHLDGISIAKFKVACKFRKVQNAKIHVGCGKYNLDGYINSDIRDLPNVHLVCKAWELDRFAENAAEIYSRHMIEHLTLHEMMTTVRIWYKCLRPGGKIILLCPDMDFHVQQYLNAKWTDEEWDNHCKGSNAKWSFAGFWGHQRGTEDIFHRTSWKILE